MMNFSNNFKMNPDGTVTINGGTFGWISNFDFKYKASNGYPTVTLTFDVTGDFIVDLPAVHHDSKEEEKHNENDDA